MTGTLVITGRSPQKIDWDTEHANGNGPLDPAIANARFEEMVTEKRMFAFADTVSGEREQIRHGGFDPETQSKVTLTPQIAGGAS